MRYVLAAALLLTGCASADPAAWRLYAKAAYFYGRIEAKAEVVCAPPRNPVLADFCREAAATQQQVQTLAPTIEAELAKDRADWAAIGKYLDLVLGLAARAL
jgi:hypothetical protein